MDTRKELESKIQISTEHMSVIKPVFIEGWKGSLPTKPFPTGKDLAQKKEDNIEWHYNASRDIYYYDKSPEKPHKESGVPQDRPVVDLCDSSDKDEVTQEKLNKESKNLCAVTQSKSSMFSLSSKVATTGQTSKDQEVNILKMKKKI